MKIKIKIIYLFLSIFFFFLDINIVKASDCSDIQEKIDNYNMYKEQLSVIDCTDNSNSSNVSICNDINVRKNIVITELMKLDEKNAICEQQKEDVNTIIEENKDKCGKIFDDSFSDFVNGFMVFFYILGPILLIFFGSLDFAKATVSADQDALKKAWKNFSKRLIATILLFLTPTIVNFIISFNVSDKYLSGNAYSCDYEYLVYTKKYNIKYVPKNNSSTTGISGSGDIIESADRVHRKHLGSWNYSLTNNINFDIEAQVNNPKKVTCCASYVAEVLYDSGIFTAEEINSNPGGYTTANSGIGTLLSSHGWIKITDYDSLQPGDIAFNSHHVQIYAGKDENGTMLWYSEGKPAAVYEYEQPYNAGMRNSFTHAYRKP